MNQPPHPIKVDSIPEEYNYIAALQCGRCGGPYRVVKQKLINSNKTMMDGIDIVCRSCGSEREVLFDISSFFGK